MPQQITVFQAADGSIHETEEQARIHDGRNAIAALASDFVKEHINTRNISKKKAERLLVQFAMRVIYPDGENLETRSTDGDQDPEDGPD